MKVQNMTSSRGNKVANQFIVRENRPDYDYIAFQSYDTVIAVMHDYGREQKVYLDSNAWDYSVTTGKYRNQFLGETKRETENTKDLDGNTGNLRVTGGQAGRKNSAQLFYGFMFLRMVSESRPWAISSLARRSNRASIS